jgi:hypothetical protein
MKTTWKLILLIICLVPSTIFAQSLDQFHRRYTLERNSGGTLIKIIDNDITAASESFSLSTEINNLTSLLQIMGKNSRSRTLFEIENDLKSVLEKLSNEKENYESITEELISIISELPSEKLWNSDKASSVYQKLEQNWMDEVKNGSFSIIANLEDKYYFYKINLHTQLMKGVISLAKSVVPGGAALNAVTYIIKRFSSFVEDSKAYHQNILLQYLTTFSPKDLGITEQERNLAISSIMEAKTKWFDVFSLFRVKKNWEGFGLRKIEKQQKKVWKRLSKHRNKYSYVGDSIGTYFYNVGFKKGNNGIVNLLKGKFLFNSRPSVTWIKERPNYVFTKRLVYELAKFAVSVIPVKFVSSVFNPLVNSFHKTQIKQEGNLWGYYEAWENDNMRKVILRQSINPILIHSLK